MYQGTSLWLWAVQGFLWPCVAALVVAIGLALLAGAALVGLGWLAWRGWLELRDRRGPAERVEGPPSITGGRKGIWSGSARTPARTSAASCGPWLKTRGYVSDRDDSVLEEWLDARLGPASRSSTSAAREVLHAGGRGNRWAERNGR